MTATPARTRPASQPPSAIDQLLIAARSCILRLTAHEAAAARCEGALLVDTRPEGDRRRFGTIPDALVVERNVLEWRLDPTGAHRLSEADDPRRLVIVFCNEGYASSLAAASLHDLGLVNAADLVGGFHAWAAAGLPVAQPTDPPGAS